MELGRTENSEIIFIHTEDLEVSIKGKIAPFIKVSRLRKLRFFTDFSQNFKKTCAFCWHALIYL